MRDAACFASAEGYRRYLLVVAPVYAALEATLEAVDAARLLPDWPRRRKLGLIRADLRAFGPVPGEPDRLLALTGADGAPASGWCAGDIFGALYVLEGATLGGALLARAMRGMGVLASGAACLLDPYGAERGVMWRAFLARLEGVTMSHWQEEALCARALATFSLFVEVGESLVNRKDARRS